MNNVGSYVPRHRTICVVLNRVEPNLCSAVASLVSRDFAVFVSPPAGPPRRGAGRGTRLPAAQDQVVSRPQAAVMHSRPVGQRQENAIRSPDRRGTLDGGSV